MSARSTLTSALAGIEALGNHPDSTPGLYLLLRGLYSPTDWTKVAVGFAVMATTGLLVGAITAKPISSMLARALKEVLRAHPEIAGTVACEITPKPLYLRRRKFLQALPLAGRMVTTTDSPTPYRGVTTYNNFYEFGTAGDLPRYTQHSSSPRP